MNQPAQPVEGERLALVRITRQMLAELIRGRIMIIDAADAEVDRMGYDPADDTLWLALRSAHHEPVPAHIMIPPRLLTCRDIGAIVDAAEAARKERAERDALAAEICGENASTEDALACLKSMRRDEQGWSESLQRRLETLKEVLGECVHCGGSGAVEYRDGNVLTYDDCEACKGTECDIATLKFQGAETATLAELQAERDTVAGLRAALTAAKDESDHYRRALVQMPDVVLSFGTREGVEEWRRWVAETFDADGKPLTPPAERATLDPNRCAVCGWPLKDKTADGCVRGNCSQRPFPARMYDPERFDAEQAEAMKPTAKEARDALSSFLDREISDRGIPA